jgi:hypothetical protein
LCNLAVVDCDNLGYELTLFSATYEHFQPFSGRNHVPPKGLNSLERQEGIARSVGDRNEAEPLVGIEPLHGRCNDYNGTDERLAENRGSRMRFKGYEWTFIVLASASPPSTATTAKISPSPHDR